MLGCPTEMLIFLKSAANIFLSPYLHPPPTSPVHRMDPALLKGYPEGMYKLSSLAKQKTVSILPRNNLPLLFSPGLWISQASMKFSSKKLSDIINTLFVCALSSSKHFHNSELALSSWCSLEAGTVKIKQLELLISELGLQKPCSPALLEVWKVAKLRNALMDSVCSAKHLVSFLELHRHDSSL